MSAETPTPSKPKLSVFADKALLKRIRREKADTDLTIEQIVNARLLLSYEVEPSLNGRAAVAAG